MSIEVEGDPIARTNVWMMQSGQDTEFPEESLNDDARYERRSLELKMIIIHYA